MLLYLQENKRKVKVTKWDFHLMPEGDDNAAGPSK
jgi:hypothetical protein